MNTFGSATQQFPLVDPREVVDARQRFRRSALPSLARANSFYAPSGRWPARGWVLLDRASYDKLSAYSTDFVLTIGDVQQANNVQALRNLSMVQAQCVTRGIESDANALYLIELTDDRGVLANNWFQAALTTQYNIRAPGYPQTFYPWSMNNGTTWTWATMLQDMWEKLATGALLGSWPGMPAGFTATGTPEGYWLLGVAGWATFVDVVEHLGLAVAYNPTTATSPYTLVVDGAVDATFTALQARYAATNLEDDLEWKDIGAGRVPGSVTVAFRRRNAVYGSEEAVRYDSPRQWESSPYYAINITAPSVFTGATGTHLIWSDYTVRYDMDGSAFASDTATALQIATERVTQYYDRIYSGTVGFMTQTYSGALPFTTGSQVDGVRWWYTGEDGGWRTQIVKGPQPPWRELWDDNGYSFQEQSC